ncbi:PDR/VanB family oxidoreductase [Auritidibacter ignavus]|uniref:PDR/VanB family oxidoreductase n=1 Tax=Auritidibacter ignavus TaxID=678932 RepID=UPI003A5CB7AA
MTLVINTSEVPITSEVDKLVVKRRETIADNVIRITLGDPKGRRLPPWTPGAHLELILPNGLIRHYSLCGDRWDGFFYQIAILRTLDSRGGSSWIHDHLDEGAVLEFGGPRNHFPLVPADQYKFIAGGIGITPLIPMIEQVQQSGQPWQLLYGGRSRGSMAFAEELSRFGDRVDLLPQDEYGLPDIPSWVGPPTPRTAVYSCGPEGLLRAVETACSTWPSSSLWNERFVAKDQSQLPERAFTLQLRSGGSITVEPGQSTLDSIRALGGDILSSCKQGVCGTCEVGVLDGIPDHRDSVLSEHDREAGDCMLVCVSRARSQTLTLDL